MWIIWQYFPTGIELVIYSEKSFKGYTLARNTGTLKEKSKETGHTLGIVHVIGGKGCLVGAVDIGLLVDGDLDGDFDTGLSTGALVGDFVDIGLRVDGALVGDFDTEVSAGALVGDFDVGLSTGALDGDFVGATGDKVGCGVTGGIVGGADLMILNETALLAPIIPVALVPVNGVAVILCHPSVNTAHGG
jgi:hypothetical protein